MKCIKHSLGNFDQLQILPLADLHLGDIHSDGKKINEWLNYIRETPNCYTILNGDLMNTAIKTSVSDTYLLVQLANIIDADCYVHSHTHVPAIVRNSYYRVDTRHCNIVKVDRLFVNTSSTLDYGGYGEFYAYKPNSLETPLIILDGHQHKMQAVL